MNGLFRNCLAALILSVVCNTSPAWSIIVARLGDSIAIDSQPFLEAALPDDTIVFPELSNLSFPANNQGTKQWLAIDNGFTEPRFVRRINQVPNRDVIVANVGIHNMRVESAFGTTPTLYEQHLNQIFDALEQTNVPIVWVTTTPVPFDHPTIEESRQAGYRQRELAVATQRADVVVDVYDLLVHDFEEHPWRAGPANLHLNDDGSVLVAEAVADAVVGLKGALLASVPEPSGFLGCLCVVAWWSSQRYRG